MTSILSITSCQVPSKSSSSIAIWYANSLSSPLKLSISLSMPLNCSFNALASSVAESIADLKNLFFHSFRVVLLSETSFKAESIALLYSAIDIVDGSKLRAFVKASCAGFSRLFSGETNSSKSI